MWRNGERVNRKMGTYRSKWEIGRKVWREGRRVGMGVKGEV